jgi:hypothetical protein
MISVSAYSKALLLPVRCISPVLRQQFLGSNYTSSRYVISIYLTYQRWRRALHYWSCRDRSFYQMYDRSVVDLSEFDNSYDLLVLLQVYVRTGG